MKVKVRLVMAIHETKHGTNTYVRQIKKDAYSIDIIDAISADCDYDENNPNDNLYIDTESLIIDTDECEPA